MATVIEIDGWRCWVEASGTRAVSRSSSVGATCYALKPDGSITSNRNDDVPPTVFAWLVRPLLREAWRDGGLAHHQASNPYEDE